MKQPRNWLITLAIISLICVAGSGLYIALATRDYSTAVFYPDTAFRKDRERYGWPEAKYVEQSGRLTLMLARGEPHGIITTSHGWHDQIAINIPRPAEGDRIDLSSSATRIAFHSLHDGRLEWRFDDEGVKGHLLIESVRSQRITASFDIVVHVVTNDLLPQYSKSRIYFHGRETFRAKACPFENGAGWLWPKT